MKKRWCLILAMVLLAASIPAAMAAENDDPYVITWLKDGLSESYNTADFEIGRHIKEKFNIEIEFVAFTGDWSEKCALWLAGGDYPEIMQINTAELTQQYINAGALLSYDDYQDIMPDFFARFAAALPSARACAPDGKLYFYISQTGALSGTYDTPLAWTVRSDLLEEQGWPNLLTASEWLEFFKTAKANHPTTEDGLETYVDLPLGEAWGYNTLGVLIPEVYHVSGGNQVKATNLLDESHPILDTWADNALYHDTLAFWNAMWRNDLLDPECFTDKCDQLVAKSNTTQCLASWYARWLFGSTNNLMIERGTPQYTYVEMPFRTDATADSPRIIMQVNSMVPGFGNIVVTKNCKQPERVMELINFLSSDEGMLLHHWGVEGVDYVVDPETGKRDASPELLDLYINDHDGAFKQKGFSCFDNLGVNYGQNYNPIDMQPGNINYSDSIQALSYTERQLEAIEKTNGDPLPWHIYCGEHSRLQNTVIVTDTLAIEGWTIPAEEEELLDLEQEILDYTYMQIPKIIMAETEEEFEALFAETIQFRKDMGIDKILNFLQERIDALAAE